MSGVDRGRVQAVETDKGEIETEIVVNAGGMYARDIGRLAGVERPDRADGARVPGPGAVGLPTEMPTMRDPSLLVYFRPESGGLIMGGYERHCPPWSLDGIPADFNAKLLEEDWPRFEELMDNALVRVPSLGEMGVVKLINGPEAFTPDGEFILGPSDVPGFWVAAGFCAHGLAGAGGMGKLVAEWIVEGTPSLDVWHMDSRRFGAAYRSRDYTVARTREIYETYYDVKYPGHERQAGRPLRVSPAYQRLKELGAVFGEKSGWERANWFEPNAAAGDESLRPRGWAGMHWSPAIGAEHSRLSRDGGAVRRVLVRQDRSGRRGRSRVPGVALRQPRRPRRRCRHLHADAQPARRRRVRLHRHPTRGGSLPHRHRHGVRPARPLLDPPAPARKRQRPGHRRHLGPRLLRALGPCQPRDPPAAHHHRPLERRLSVHARQELAVGTIPCLALRVTYVGELGWELYCPGEFGQALWDTLWHAGRAHRLVAGGYKAIDSLRLEKGYRVWGADVTPEETPYEAGLGFAVKLDKGEFVGREALARGASPRERSAASPSTTPARSHSAPSRCGSATSRSAGSRAAVTATRPASRSPTPTCPAEHAGGRNRRRGRDLRRLDDRHLAAEPLLDPDGARIRA